MFEKARLRKLPLVLSHPVGTAEEVRQDFERNWRECDSVVLIYGAAPQIWVRNQIMLYNKLKREREKPLREFIMLNCPPQQKPPVGIALPEVEGRSPPSERIPLPWSSARVSGDFFEVVGVRIIDGRTFAPDDGEDMVIVNDVFARRYLGSGSPIGRRFRTESGRPWLTVIGVAKGRSETGQPIDIVVNPGPRTPLREVVCLMALVSGDHEPGVVA